MQTDKTEQQAINILFTHYGDEWIRGSERCLLDLLTHIDRSKFKPIVWCNSHVMAEHVKALNVTVFQNEFPLLFGWNSPRFNFHGFAKLIKTGIKLVDQHNIKLLHANSGAPNQWLNLVARARGIPLVAHLHARYQLRDRISLGFHHVPVVIGVSQPVIDSLQQDGETNNDYRVIANGIDTEKLDQQPSVNLRKHLGLKPTDFLIATVASLIKRKGVDLIIDALSLLIKQGIPVHLVVIGEGEERAVIERQIEENGTASAITLLGEQSNIMALLRNNADIFVSAAREEVFGLVLAEAGLARLAVVAPAVGGIPGVIKNGVTGLLVKPENTTELSAAIKILFEKPQLREKMGEAARKHVLNNFTIQRNVKEFQALYSHLLNDSALQHGWFDNWHYRQPLLQCVRHLLKLNRANQVMRVSS